VRAAVNVKIHFISVVYSVATLCQYIMAVNKKIEEALDHIKVAEKR
jgi:hypothetical protein